MGIHRAKLPRITSEALDSVLWKNSILSGNKQTSIMVSNSFLTLYINKNNKMTTTESHFHLML